MLRVIGRDHTPGCYHKAMSVLSGTDRPRYLPPETELDEKFTLAGGPGGQHVNKTETAVQLKFAIWQSDFISGPVKARLIKLAGSRADADGVVTIEARSHRSQLRNREEARERLAELIEKAHYQPRKRIATRPSRSAKKKRLKAKRHRGHIKQKRSKPDMDD